MNLVDGNEPDSPIEAYLDELVIGWSARHPRPLRHLLAEAEAHLRDDTERGVAAGLSQREAETQAIQRFGLASDIIAAERRRLATPLVVLARQLLSTALLLGSIGALAVGLSGITAEITRIVAGSRILVDTRPGTVLTASDCARWLAGDPGAHSCRDAAIADWVGEVVGYRIVVGLLGLLGLGAFALLRRRWTRRERWTTLPPAVSDTVAVTLFGVAGMWTLGIGIDLVVSASGSGSGQWLSAAPVALIAAAIFGARLIRDLRNPGGGMPYAYAVRQST